ncbi:MAG TPA: MFS transporter, partial [Jatrophihabitans sp.]|nr:MFS transporter [Jatrophihabitans sp.]
LARPAPRTGAILAVLLLGQFMAILDVSIVNVAAPTLRTDLHASGAGLQLAVAGYTMSYAALLITGARLGDRLGHGRAFRFGLAAFTVASLLCGLAPDIAALVTFRVVQGAGAALMMPQVMSLIQRNFDGATRARALSLYSAVIACGAVVGQVLGGVIVSADLFGSGWRPVFLVNVPIGLALLVLAGRYLPAGRGEPGRELDPAGVTVLTGAVLLFVLPLVLGHEEGWPAWCWVSFAASAVALAGFVAVERRLARRGGSPLVSGRVLRAPGFALGAAALFFALINYGGYLFAMALHLQGGLHESAERAGLVFAPMAIGFAVTGLLWRRLPTRMHAPMVPAGLLLATVCYLVLAPILRGGASGGAAFEVDLLVVGLALGLAFSPMITLALAHVPLADAADASGVLVTVFQLGQLVGIATLGTTYLSLVHAPGAAASAHALGVTLVALAASALVAAGFAVGLVRPRRASISGTT